MMNHAPTKITILRAQQNDYTVLIETWNHQVECADRLVYDEMLGFVARMFVPVGSDGQPMRNSWGQPLFLQKPEPPHPDAAGDKQPTTIQLRDSDGKLTGMYHVPDPNAGNKTSWPEGISGRAFNEYHWQIRRMVNGKCETIWNIYPTSIVSKLSCDKNHSGPLFTLPNPMTLDACIEKAKGLYKVW